MARLVLRLLLLRRLRSRLLRRLRSRLLRRLLGRHSISLSIYGELAARPGTDQLTGNREGASGIPPTEPGRAYFFFFVAFLAAAFFFAAMVFNPPFPSSFGSRLLTNISGDMRLDTLPVG